MNASLIQKSPSLVPGEKPIDYTLSPYTPLIIGREPSQCQLVLNSEYYASVSRVHLEIRPVKYPTTNEMITWELFDYSSNGTYINEQKVQGNQILHQGDVIKLGKNGPEFIFNCEVKVKTVNNNNTTNLNLSQLLPIASRNNHLFKKGFLIPGIFTVILIVVLFISLGTNNLVFYLLAIGFYLITMGYYTIYLLCGKKKPWWLLITIALTEILILISPITLLFIYIFRGILPGGIPANNFATALIANFFGAGLMEELLKALPAFGLIFLSRFWRSPWLEKLGICEPLDGILILAASGAGFTFLETLGQYVPSIIAESGEFAGLALLIPRTLGSVAGHMAYSGYFGYFIGLSMLKPSKRWLLLAIGWFTAAAMHGFWNASGFISSNGFVSALFLAVAGILAYVFLIAAILKARQISPSRAQNFATQMYNPK